MDSDDEFDPEVVPASKVIDGFNLRELLETGSTNFSMDDNCNENFGGDGDNKRMMAEEVAAAESLEDPFVKAFSTIRFHGIREEDTNRLSDFDASYDELELTMDNIVPDGGVKKLIIRPGLGEEIGRNKIAYMHYFVWLEGNDVPLDNSKTHLNRGRTDQPYRFKVGEGGILPVMDIAVSTMQPREVAKFLAQPKYAYGKLGCPPRIPPNSRVLVTIEIVAVEEGSTKTNIKDMDRTERMLLPFDELFKWVKELKVYGNDAYKVEEYATAKRQYKEALKILHDITTPKEAENKLKITMMYTLNINAAQCAIMSKSFKSAKSYCEVALGLPLPRQKKLKAYYRLAKTMDELGDVELAKKYINICKSLHPNDEDVLIIYNKVNSKILKDRKDETVYTKNMFQKQ